MSERRRSSGNDFNALISQEDPSRLLADPDPRRIKEIVNFLIIDDDPKIEAALQSLFENGSDRTAELASRILAERDPGRDPAYLVGRFPNVLEPARSASDMRSSLSFFDRDSPLYVFPYGFARLRRLEPVGVNSMLLDHQSTLVRSLAAANLGETQDLEALDPLAKALVDSNHRVRRNAADAVRRLRHAGVASVLPTHRVRSALTNCLHDQRSNVQIAAARALGALEDMDPVREAMARIPLWRWKTRREFTRTLQGSIPPLRKTWPGDKTI